MKQLLIIALLLSSLAPRLPAQAEPPRAGLKEEPKEPPRLSTGERIEIPDVGFSIVPPNGWMVNRNSHGSSLLFEAPKQPNQSYMPTIQVMVFSKPRYVDEVTQKEYGDLIVEKFGKLSNRVTGYHLRSSEIVQMETGDPAILYYTEFQYDEVPIMQMHILISSATDHFLMSYTDVAKVFEDDNGSPSLGIAYASMHSAQLASQPHWRWRGFVIAGVALFLVLLGWFTMRFMRARKLSRLGQRIEEEESKEDEELQYYSRHTGVSETNAGDDEWSDGKSSTKGKSAAPKVSHAHSSHFDDDDEPEVSEVVPISTLEKSLHPGRKRRGQAMKANAPDGPGQQPQSMQQSGQQLQQVQAAHQPGQGQYAPPTVQHPQPGQAQYSQQPGQHPGQGQSVQQAVQHPEHPQQGQAQYGQQPGQHPGNLQPAHQPGQGQYAQQAVQHPEQAQYAPQSGQHPGQMQNAQQGQIPNGVPSGHNPANMPPAQQPGHVQLAQQSVQHPQPMQPAPQSVQHSQQHVQHSEQAPYAQAAQMQPPSQSAQNPAQMQHAQQQVQHSEQVHYVQSRQVQQASQPGQAQPVSQPGQHPGQAQHAQQPGQAPQPQAGHHPAEAQYAPQPAQNHFAQQAGQPAPSPVMPAPAQQSNPSVPPPIASPSETSQHPVQSQPMMPPGQPQFAQPSGAVPHPGQAQQFPQNQASNGHEAMAHAAHLGLVPGSGHPNQPPVSLAEQPMYIPQPQTSGYAPAAQASAPSPAPVAQTYAPPPQPISTPTMPQFAPSDSSAEQPITASRQPLSTVKKQPQPRTQELDDEGPEMTEEARLSEILPKAGTIEKSKPKRKGLFWRKKADDDDHDEEHDDSSEDSKDSWSTEGSKKSAPRKGKDEDEDESAGGDQWAVEPTKKSTPSRLVEKDEEEAEESAAWAPEATKKSEPKKNSLLNETEGPRRLAGRPPQGPVTKENNAAVTEDGWNLNQEAASDHDEEDEEEVG